ncbi:SCAN domain-containing protein 3-like [Leptopilina boulardi]|uniref:SCAN domain-containing protein 3-like n=1 Tax=Leptopilina boulardi TaxID=63433 RepID=UPI0021F56683|nr:SCAN domain-containing protein 3-like [Leptopilina boulardi]
MNEFLEESPATELEGDQLIKKKTKFFIDTGADINVIKGSALKGEAINKHTFHVVEDDFPIAADGVLGRPYLREERAKLDFFYNMIVTQSKPTDPIPFIDIESKTANNEMKGEGHETDKLQEEQLQTNNENGGNKQYIAEREREDNKVLEKEILEEIRESIKRYDMSIAEHQSYFWDDEIIERPEEAEIEEEPQEQVRTIDEIIAELRELNKDLEKTTIKPNLDRLEKLEYRRESLTETWGNYVHFMSADLELNDPVNKLMSAIGAIDIKEMKRKKQRKGQILVTSRSKYKTFTVIIKTEYDKVINEEDLREVLVNLRNVLLRENVKSIRIPRHTITLDELEPTWINKIVEIFFRDDIQIQVCFGEIVIPPEEYRTKIIAAYHDSLIAGHKGVNKTYHRIREKYTWPGLRQDITEYIRKCRSCAQKKIVRNQNRENMIITDTPLDAWERVSLDTVGKLPTTANGNCHVLTMQDQLSKYSIFVAIPDISATTIAHAIATNLFSVYGAPKCILTDQGRSFTSDLLRKLAKIFKVSQVTTTAYRPQTNGGLERSHAVLAEFLRHYAKTKDDWDRLLPYAMFAYNTSVHEATKFTPYEVIFGKIARTPSIFPTPEKLETYESYIKELVTRLIEIRRIVAKNIIQRKEKVKESYDNKTTPLNIKIGDFVDVKEEVRAGKFSPYYHGPYRVEEITKKNNLILSDAEKKRFRKHKDQVKRAFL